MSTASDPSPTQSAPAPASDGRQRILDTSAALFLERGYAGTSLRDIAAAVGMKAGSLYYHFASKDQLFETILLRGIDVMVEAFEYTTREHAASSARTRFGAHVRAHIGALYEHGPYTAVHVTTFRTAPEAVREAIVPARDAYEALWTELLRALRDRGELAPTPSLSVARLMLFGAMNASVEWYDTRRGDLDGFADTIAEQFWSGLVGARSASDEPQGEGSLHA